MDFFFFFSWNACFSCKETNFQWVCAFRVWLVPRRAILLTCHRYMGPPRQAAPNISNTYHQRLRLNMTCECFLCLLRGLCMPTNYPVPFLWWHAQSQTHWKFSPQCLVLFVFTALLFSHVIQPFPFPFLKILPWCVFYRICFYFDCLLVYVQCSNAALVTAHVFFYVFFSCVTQWSSKRWCCDFSACGVIPVFVQHLSRGIL